MISELENGRNLVQVAGQWLKSLEKERKAWEKGGIEALGNIRSIYTISEGTVSITERGGDPLEDGKKRSSEGTASCSLVGDIASPAGRTWWRKKGDDRRNRISQQKTGVNR